MRKFVRKFVSYGPIIPQQYYYAPRTELLDFAYHQLVGEDAEVGGHYITVWAPRQTGKTGVMQQIVSRLRKTGEFEVGILNSNQNEKRIFENAEMV
jgi:hypothetical protein